MNLLLAFWDLSLVLALVALCTAIGRLAISRFSRLSIDSRELLFCSLGMGIGLVGTITFLLGLMGLTTPVGLSMLLGGLAVAARRQLRELPPLLAGAFSEFIGGWSRMELLAISTLGVFILAHAALPVANYDSLFYHLAIPELYLREGRIYLPPNNLHAAYIGIMHMLYLPLLAFGSSSAPALLNGVLTIGLIPLVHLLGEGLWDRETGRLAAILVWAAPVLFLVGITPRVDVTLVWFLLLAHHLAIGGLRNSEKLELLTLSCVLLGVAFAVKASALLYILGLIPLLVWGGAASGGTWQVILGRLLILATAVAIPAIPWLVKNWVWLGDPLYPHFSEKAVQGWLLEVYGGHLPTFEVATPAIRQIRQPFNIPDFFFAPQRLTPEGEGILYFANPVLLLLPLVLLRRRWKPILLLALPAIAYGLALLILHDRGTNLRYLIPTVVPLVLVSVACITALLHGSVRWLITALLLIPSVISMTLWSASQLAWSYLVEDMPETEYLSIISNQEIRAYLNSEIEEDGRILMLFDGRVYGIERSRIPDPPGLSNWLQLAPAAAESCLEGSRVTHIVVNDHLLTYQISRGLDPESIRWPEFSGFAERCLRQIWGEGSYRVYEVKGRGN